MKKEALIGIKMPIKMAEDIKKLAQEDGYNSLSPYIRQLMSDALQRKKRVNLDKSLMAGVSQTGILVKSLLKILLDDEGLFDKLIHEAREEAQNLIEKVK